VSAIFCQTILRRIRVRQQLAKQAAPETQRASKPTTVSFYKHKLAFSLKFEPLAPSRPNKH
jgi:hypothetical protein